MIKNDEILLYAALRARFRGAVSWGGRAGVEESADALGMNYKRADFLLEKWERKGYTSSGVSPWCGWFENDAPDSLGELRPEKPLDVLRQFDQIGDF